MALADGGGCCYGGGGGVGGGKSPPPLSSTTQLPKQSKEAEKTEFKPKEVNEEEEEQQQTKAVNFKGGNFERSSSSSSSTVVRTPAAELVHIKKESTDDVVILEDDHFDGGKDNFGSFSSSSSMAVPKPMEGLYEAGPPPFLSKTFQMVDDPETDSIVSWGEARQSFIVWDHYELSKTLLPKYFKHNNFSSFIRQLNTYGFKKVDPDRWEFANEAFQGGKKHLLKNIKRRSRYYRQQPTVVVSADPTKAGLEAQIELLMKDHDFLKLEILNLRQQQMYSQHQISAFEERIRSSECKQQRMLLFLTKTATNHALVRQLAHKRVLKREIDGGDLGKSRRLPPAQDLESYREWNDSSHNVGSRNQLQDELVSMQSVLAEQMAEPMANQQNKTPFSAPIVDESCSAAQDAKCPVTDGASKEEIPSAYDDGMSTKFLEENLVFDDEFEVNDSNFYQELEDLIAKPRDWTRYVSNYLVEQPGCVG